MHYIITAAIVMIADILTKITATKRLAPVGTIEIIRNILSFTYVENNGIAFGMFSGQRIVFIIISVIILFLIFGIIYKTPKDNRSVFLKLGGAITVSGAIGNLIDRIVYGYVIDFIEFTFIDFPVFNIADIAICVGAAMLVIHFMFLDGKNKPVEGSSHE